MDNAFKPPPMSDRLWELTPKKFSGTKVAAVGINDLGPISMKVDGKRQGHFSYAAWGNMLRRCYIEACHERFPSHIGVTVTPEWLLFSNFHKDAQTMGGYGRDGYVLTLDPELGAEVYSLETACWIPLSECMHYENLARAKQSKEGGL
jgi:hypothetical protein